MSKDADPFPVRTLTGQHGEFYTVVDDFPDQFTISEDALQKADGRFLSHDEPRRRLWVRVANGRAEYTTEHNAYNNTWTCRRIYRQMDWPAPKESSP